MPSRTEDVKPDLEHLKLIHGVTARLAGNSFLLKLWSLSLVTGVEALAKAVEDPDIAWISLLVLAVCALLDAYYLALERAYRRLYDGAAGVVDTTYRLRVQSVLALDVLRALTSFSVSWFYAAVAAGAILVATGTI